MLWSLRSKLLPETEISANTFQLLSLHPVNKYLDFNKVWVAPGNEAGIVFKFFRIPLLDQRQSVDCPLTLHNRNEK